MAHALLKVGTFGILSFIQNLNVVGLLTMPLCED